MASHHCWSPSGFCPEASSIFTDISIHFFINDISDSLRYCDHMILAIDTQIYFQCPPSDLVSASDLVNYDIELLQDMRRQVVFYLIKKNRRSLFSAVMLMSAVFTLTYCRQQLSTTLQFPMCIKPVILLFTYPPISRGLGMSHSSRKRFTRYYTV